MEYIHFLSTDKYSKLFRELQVNFRFFQCLQTQFSGQFKQGIREHLLKRESGGCGNMCIKPDNRRLQG